MLPSVIGGSAGCSGFTVPGCTAGAVQSVVTEEQHRQPAAGFDMSPGVAGPASVVRDAQAEEASHFSE